MLQIHKLRCPYLEHTTSSPSYRWRTPVRGGVTCADHYDSSNSVCCPLLLLRVKGFRVTSVSMSTLKMFSNDLLLWFLFFPLRMQHFPCWASEAWSITLNLSKITRSITLLPELKRYYHLYCSEPTLRWRLWSATLCSKPRPPLSSVSLGVDEIEIPL